MTLVSSALAAPWTPSDDAGLRLSVEWLADRGCIVAPVTSWPIMWADLQLVEEATDDCRLSPAWQHVRSRKVAQGSSGSLTLAGGNQTPLFRYFSAPPREKAQATLRLETHHTHFSAGLSASYVAEPQGLDRQDVSNRWRADGSYLAGQLGNWSLGVGAIDRWWGPGQSNSLLLSHNARPVPAVFLQRRQSNAFDVPVLRWLGAWHVSAFAGQLESERFVPDAKLIGLRATIKPASWLELGAARAIQWGGEGRPQTASSLWEAFIGRDNIHGDRANEPGNQLAGFDFRVSKPIGLASTWRFYGQLVGEDEAGYLPSKNAYLFGTGMSGQWWQGQQQWWVEYVNTLANDLDGRSRPNVLYEHHLYKSGYRYYGRPLGSTWDNDSRVITLGAQQVFSSGRAIEMAVSGVHLNVDGTAKGGSLIATNRSNKVLIYHLQYRQPLLRGHVLLSVQGADRKLDFIQVSPRQVTVMAEWEYRFGL